MAREMSNAAAIQANESPLSKMNEAEQATEKASLKAIGVILLASGSSSRMGANKLLLPVGQDNIPCVRAIAQQPIRLDVGAVLAVYKEESVKAALEDLGIAFIHNPSAALGQSESIKRGVSCEWPETIQAWAFVMGDQPFLTAEACEKIFRGFLENDCNIAVPVADNKRCSPVVFHRLWKDRLLALEGDTGAKALMDEADARVLEIFFDAAEPFEDIDTPEAYRKLMQRPVKTEKQGD